LGTRHGGSSKGPRAKETSRKSSGPSISPITARFSGIPRKVDRSLRGISVSSEPSAFVEGGATAATAAAGADNLRGGRKSLDSSAPNVFAPMAPGGNGNGNGSGNSSEQVSPVATRDSMPFFAGDVNGHPPTPVQPGDTTAQQQQHPQQPQGGISLFGNRFVATGATSGGDQVCKPHGGVFLSDDGSVSLASSFSTLKKAGEKLSAATNGSRPRPRRSHTFHQGPSQLPLTEEDKGSDSPARALGSKRSKTGGTEDGIRRSERNAPS
jgi:hypothetical protein